MVGTFGSFSRSRPREGAAGYSRPIRLVDDVLRREYYNETVGILVCGTKNEDLLAFAGLYEFWPDPSLPENDPERWLLTCTVLTTSAHDSLGHVHDRAPVIIPPDIRRLAGARNHRLGGRSADVGLRPGAGPDAPGGQPPGEQRPQQRSRADRTGTGGRRRMSAGGAREASDWPRPRRIWRVPPTP